MSLINQSLAFNIIYQSEFSIQFHRMQRSIYLPILTTEKQVEETENKDDIDQVQYLTENV